MNSKKAIASHIPNIKYIFIIPVSPPPVFGWPGTKERFQMKIKIDFFLLLHGAVKHSVSVHVVCALRSILVKRFMACS